MRGLISRARRRSTRSQVDTAQALVSQLAATVKADQAMIDMAQAQLGCTRIDD
jgi:multidrug efflux pump subunit AcrA (membrane-fusion protein)